MTTPTKPRLSAPMTDQARAALIEALPELTWLCTQSGFTKTEAIRYDALLYVHAPALLAAVRELESVNEKLKCGHRKLDWDDSYGGCVFCIINKAHWDCEEGTCGRNEAETERDALRAETQHRGEELTRLSGAVSRLYAENERLREQVGVLRSHDECDASRENAKLRRVAEAAKTLKHWAAEIEVRGDWSKYVELRRAEAALDSALAECGERR